MTDVRDTTENKIYLYDIALSFAGEDRDYVEQVAIQLKRYGVRLFYDKFEESSLWGKNLIDYLNDIYNNKARYTVMFISQHYRDKRWTSHERKSIQERAFRESSEYILPARFDNTEIPGLHSTVAYIDLQKKTPFEFTQLVLDKIGWKTRDRWWGKWVIDSPVIARSGEIYIRDVSSNGFEFRVTTTNGAHSGGLSGFAEFTSTNEAIFRTYIGDDDGCELNFVKYGDLILVSESYGCHHHHGARAYFNGDYQLSKDIFYQLAMFSDFELSALFKLLKGDTYWEKYITCFGDVSDETVVDNFEADAIAGGVAGLYTIYEAILMRTKDSMWGAFLDGNDIRYFSSTGQRAEDFPRTIAQWMKKFDRRNLIAIT